MQSYLLQQPSPILKERKCLKSRKKKQAARDIKTKTLMEQQNALLEEISRKIGSVDVNIPIKIERSVLNMEWVYIPYADESFYASLSTKQIYYKGRFVAFDKIVNCDYSDNATTTSTQSGTASSTIKTNTGSTVGRALVGGVIAGPVGAAIGGATAKKNAETKIENKTISTLISVANGIRIVTVTLLALLIIISVFIISNTIKLTVHARRKEISIMKYVGATNSFIRFPFMVEGIIIGMVAGAITILLLGLAYNGIMGVFAGSETLRIIGVNIVSFADMFNLIVTVYLILGLGIGVLGSSISMRKYLEV